MVRVDRSPYHGVYGAEKVRWQLNARAWAWPGTGSSGRCESWASAAWCGEQDLPHHPRRGRG